MPRTYFTFKQDLLTHARFSENLLHEILQIRSQTYSANEVDLILAIGEQNETIEWVDIDPEAFTGTQTSFCRILNTEISLSLFCF